MTGLTRERDVREAYAAHSGELYGFAVRSLGDAGLAEEAVQETFLRAWKAGDRFDPEIGSLRTWLFAILHNLFVTGLRRGRSRPRHESLDSDAGPDVPGGQEGALMGRDILRALEALPLDQRAVLLLVGVEGLSYEAASRVLGVPLGTVMSRLSRAREAMRRHMDGERPATLRRVK